MSLCDCFLRLCLCTITFNLEHEFSVSIFLHSMSHVALHHINEIRRRAGDVMSYTSLFVDGEKSRRRDSLCNETTRFALIFVTRSRGEGELVSLQVFATVERYTRRRSLVVRYGSEKYEKASL